MDELLRKIHQAQVRAAEDAVIASIPKSLMDHMKQAQAKFAAKGGCPGCGSQILAVHKGSCPTGRNDFY